MKTEPEDAEARFESLIGEWRAAAISCASAEDACTRAHASEMAVSNGKNADARNADAMMRTACERTTRDGARIHEQAARWRVQWHLARAGRQGRWEP